MKKIISLLLAVCILLASLVVLVSCAEEKDDIPEGMQLANGGEELGFYFYVPEGWVIANNGKYSAAYLSVRNYLNTTFVEGEMPDGYEQFKASGAKKTDTPPKFLQDYFNAELLKLNICSTKEITGERCDFGNSPDVDALCYRFVYEFTYESNPIKVMQILVLHADRFYIFTYTATDAEENSDYEYYLNENPNGTVSDIIKNFKLVDKKVGEEDKTTLDPEKFVCVSDKTLSGVELYLPETFIADYSSAVISATDENGRNVNFSELTLNQPLAQYWEIRKESIKLVADTQKDEAGKDVSTLNVTNEDMKVEALGNNKICVFEYSYALGGVKYSVYQVFIRTTFKDYMLTYTVSDGDVSDSDIAMVKEILSRIVF